MFNKELEHRVEGLIRRLDRLEDSIHLASKVSRILELLERLTEGPKEAFCITISQERSTMANGIVIGIVPGKSGAFKFVGNPTGSKITPPLVVLSNDPLAVPDVPVLQPDGSYTCNVAVSALAVAGGSFTLTASFKRTSDGNQAAGLMIVPYLPGVGGNEANSIDITQTA